VNGKGVLATMSNNVSGTDERPEYDPVFVNSRREAGVIFLIWLVALFWAVPFCYVTGYIGNYAPESFSTTWGIPTWLFWGIAVPWLVADLITTWFCFRYMKDDDLGQSAAEAEDGDDREAAS
jgi:hypothetical protein